MVSDSNQRLKYIDVLLEITQRIQNASSLEDALAYSAKAAGQAVNVEAVTIWLSDKDNANRILPVYMFDQTGTLDFARLPGASLANAVIASGQTKLVSSADSSDDGWRLPAENSGFAIRNAVCVPLISRAETLGCIQFVNKLGVDTFLADDLELCENLASIAAIAIDGRGMTIKAGQSQKALVSIRDLSKEYTAGTRTQTVLSGINLDIFEHELVVIVGVSGSGKSTLLKIIGGMDNATSGSIKVDGRDLSRASDSELANYRRHEIGFVFQSYYLLPNLTAKENLSLISEIANDPLDVSSALELVAMRERARNYPAQLSGGQQQRVSIARAIVKKPKLILADEPTAALDFKTSIDVLELLESVVKQKLSTVVLITHNPEIAKMADRVVRISDGQVADIAVNMAPLSARELKW